MDINDIRSKIKINHEYVYNDYSDGDWELHKLGYAVILGKKYKIHKADLLLAKVLERIIETNQIQIDDLIKETDKQNIMIYKSIAGLDLQTRKICRKMINIELWVRAGYSMTETILKIEKILRMANLPDDSVKLSFID